MEDTRDNPLVSIIVVTYNSAQYVIETLESAKNQTYKHIELIITDDSSTDNTINICQEWLKENQVHFLHAEIIATNKNSGIAANCNRGLSAAKGEWIKFIAGDDTLVENCLENNLKYIRQNPYINILQSNIDHFHNIFSSTSFMGTRDLKNHPIAHKNILPEEQYSILLHGCIINSPTVFIKKNIFDEVGKFDEKIQLIEDWPMWLKVTKAGHKIHFMPLSTVKYRFHGNSICNEIIEDKLYNNHMDRERLVFKNYIFCDLPLIEKMFINYEYYRRKIVKSFNLNKTNIFCRLINSITSRPAVWFKSWNDNRIINRFEKKCLSRNNEKTDIK